VRGRGDLDRAGYICRLEEGIIQYSRAQSSEGTLRRVKSGFGFDFFNLGEELAYSAFHPAM
jgi:hypothetical protein